MDEKPPVFTVGMLVKWNEKRRQSPDFANVSAGMGEGPFQVVDVGNVTSYCTCGYEACPDMFPGHHPLCTIYNLVAAGHPQLVAVQSTFFGLVWLSGAWLEPF